MKIVDRSIISAPVDSAQGAFEAVCRAVVIDPVHGTK
jgi:hypothetical protein